MATAQFASMGNNSHVFKSELEPMESFFDFSQGTTPRAPSRSSSSRPGPSRPTANLYNVPSPIEETEERQVFAGPSHEYDRFQQQTGVTVGLANLNQPIPQFSNDQVFGAGFNSGIDDMTYNGGLDGWATGIDMDADMGVEFGSNTGLPAMFFPDQINQHPNALIDPASLDSAEEPQSSVGRVWPGMHQQQAQQQAMARAQAQQAHQQKLQAQQQQQMQQKGKARVTSYQADPLTEQSISRLLNQMRSGSMASNMNDDDMQNGVLPHVARMRKEEEDMDEDERLLASDEGKKLSSKERRQLRNKVSARAFRSRRKEYIGQLEGEVAVKAQEANSLKTENQSLHEENARYRSLIETLLRHPAFVPFVEDISKDPSLLIPMPQHQQRQPAPTPAPAPAPASAPQQQEVKPFDFSAQMQVPKQQEIQHVGMTMIPEAPVDLSMLNINNQHNNFNPNMSRRSSYNNYQQPQVFSVRDLPQGPSALDIALDAVNQSRRQEEQYDNACISNANTPYTMNDDFAHYADSDFA